MRGIIVPVITPMSDPFTVDTKALAPLFNHIIHGGVDGIFILGSTGEGPALTIAEQKRFIQAAGKVIDGRVSYLVGISGASGAETIGMGHYAIDNGADAVVAAVPCYIPADHDEEIINYYTVLAKEFPGKLYVYNMPAMTKVKFSTDLAIKLLNIDGVAGYKDSCGVFEDFLTVLKATKHLNKDLFIGPEHLTKDAVLAGGSGGVNGGANLSPELFSGLIKAIDASDVNAIELYQEKIMKFQSYYGEFPITSTMVIRALKYELSKLGIVKNILAFPNLPKL